MTTVEFECFPRMARSQGLVEGRHVAPQRPGLEEKVATLCGPDHTEPESAPQYMKRLIQGVACPLGARIRP